MAGASKLYELATALGENYNDAPSCMAYLNNDETTCQHPHFKSLIQVKYYSSLSLAGLVVVYVLQLWSSEYYFMKFMNCLCISPLFTNFLALVAASLSTSPGEEGSLSNKKVWELCIVMTILYGTVAPKSVDHLPFFTSKMENSSVKLVSPQAVVLWCLIGSSLWEVARVFYVHFSESGGLQNALLDTPVPLPENSKALVYFWVVDKIAMALLYTFAVVHLPVFKQRAILSSALGIKLCEYYMQLPNMSDPWKDQHTVLFPMTMGLAILSGLAWFI